MNEYDNSADSTMIAMHDGIPRSNDFLFCEISSQRSRHQGQIKLCRQLLASVRKESKGIITAAS